MTKLFKNSKQVLAFVFAFAVLAVSLFTGSANITADACDVSKIDYWDGTKASSFASGTGTEADPFIIKTAEQLALACLGQSPASSTGKFYKVDDSVKTFVMQPQNVVDLDTLLALDSAEATKNYLTGLTGVKNWQTQFGYSSFNGNFDGNGATIYGLYADTVAANMDDCGLFPQFDGGYKDGSGNVVPTTCKNITVKNSYFKSKRRLGVITGAAYGTNYGAKIDGKVKVDTAAVINCYLEGNAQSIPHYQEEGIVVGGGNMDVIEINNVLVKGTYAYDTVQAKRINVIGAASNVKIPDPNDPTKTIYQTKITNSVFLGVAPYRVDHFTNELCEPHVFDNVYTDQASGEVTLTNPAGWGSATSKRNYTEDQIKQVTASGFDFKAAATTLDWENTWFMSENGPELRKFHGEIKFIQTETTHVWECADCGLTSPGGVKEHDFVLQGDEVVGDGTDVYACSVCGYTCTHGQQSDATYDPGNCLVAPGTYSRCAICEWYIVSNVGEVPGHNLTYVSASEGDCHTDGHTEYWECSTCNNKFTSDDKFAPFESAVEDADLSTGLGKHVVGDDAVYLYDENGHWYICSIEDGTIVVRVNADGEELKEGEVIKHVFSGAFCLDCGYECKEHVFVKSRILQAVGCDNDEITEFKCNLCGFKKQEVTLQGGHNIEFIEKVAADDKMEGTKEHYKCKVCQSKFVDAEGKKPATNVSLIIPKVLPAEYQGGIIYDPSNTSPSTSDSFASVIAVAALAGAALVFARKVK